MAIPADHHAPGPGRPADRHAELERSAGSAISPELVLVSPDLQEAARAALPDRPWEQFAPPVASPPAPSPRAGAAERPVAIRKPVPPPLADPPPSVPLGTPRPQPLPVGEPPPIRTRRLAVRVVGCIAALVGIAHLGAWESGGERLLPLEDSAPLAGGPGSARAYASTLYVIGPGAGFRTGPGAEAITSVRLPVTCRGRTVVVHRVAIRPNGTFRYVGSADDRKVRVTLAGRFLDRERAKASVEVSGPGCPDRKIGFEALVS